MIVGNGHKISIQHVGRGIFRSKNDVKLVLNDVLHTPTIVKNLISVSRLTQDNHVSIELFPTCCVVKDLATRRVLLQGTVKEGLYQLGSHKTESQHYKFPQLSTIVCQLSGPFSGLV